MKIQVDQLADAVMKALDGYTKDMAQDTKDAIQKVGKEGLQALKANSPVRANGGKPGSYKKGWRFKVIEESNDKINAVLHNATNPGLPHLLEHGHALRQGGRARAIEHIAPVEEQVCEQLEREIEELANK